MAKLTSEDEAVIARTPVTREQFAAERAREEAEGQALRRAAEMDKDGLTPEDRQFLRANPSINREKFIQARRQEIAGH